MLFGKKINTVIYVDGMSCGHCAARVEGVFNEMKGATAKVDLAEKSVHITSKSPIDEKEAFDKISALGFTPVRMEVK